MKRHRRSPLHWIEVCASQLLLLSGLIFMQRWTGLFFVRVSLKSLGLRVQLNHTSMRCATPIPCHAALRIIHTNGIHDVAVDYCGCRTTPQHIQLLRRGLYPATQLSVKTCATFTLLKHLHHMAHATKSSTYDFYRALERETNNTGIDAPKSRYRALLRMNLQWRHLKSLKRGGRGHAESGVSGTANGELAIMCPSCPRPGINLPPGWEEVEESMRCVHLFCLI
jgi:hypothetical protein